MCRICILPTHMCPEVLIAVFAFDGFARLPLFLRHLFEMMVTMLIETLIGDKTCLNDVPMLADGHDRRIFHIEIDGHRHEIGILLALYDLFRRDGFALEKMKSS